MPLLRENRTYAELESYKNFIIICGYGRVGQEIARQLSKDRQKFIIIDKKEPNIELAKKHNFLAIHNDASKNDVLMSAFVNVQGQIDYLAMSKGAVIEETFADYARNG